MYHCTENENIIIFETGSEFKYVDRIVKEARDFLNNRGVKIFSEFKIVLRELLINAVEHGNKKSPEKMVSCTIEQVMPGFFTIKVQDDGDGFDYNSLNYDMPENPRQNRSRGYPLIREFSDEIRFNEKGNRITVSIRIKDETFFSIREENNRQIIKPNGDITATVAEKFRVLLLDLVLKNHRCFRFDLVNVTDMDSVALAVFFILPDMLSKDETHKTVPTLQRGNDFSKDESELEIIHANEELKILFRITHLDHEYKIT